MTNNQFFLTSKLCLVLFISLFSFNSEAELYNQVTTEIFFSNIQKLAPDNLKGEKLGINNDSIELIEEIIIKEPETGILKENKKEIIKKHDQSKKVSLIRENIIEENKKNIPKKTKKNQTKSESFGGKKLKNKIDNKKLSQVKQNYKVSEKIKEFNENIDKRLSEELEYKEPSKIESSEIKEINIEDNSKIKENIAENKEIIIEDIVTFSDNDQPKQTQKITEKKKWFNYFSSDKNKPKYKENNENIISSKPIKSLNDDELPLLPNDAQNIELNNNFSSSENEGLDKANMIDNIMLSIKYANIGEISDSNKLDIDNLLKFRNDQKITITAYNLHPEDLSENKVVLDKLVEIRQYLIEKSVPKDDISTQILTNKEFYENNIINFYLM